MEIVLILFFVSLAGIVLMIGRKLILPKEELRKTENNFLFEIPDSRDVKDITVKHTKKYGYIVLVSVIRFYVRSLNFVKRKSGVIYKKVEKIINRNKFHKSDSHKEVSKFLKMISEYKHKISQIKHQIIEEEKNQS